jgi:hypothetical protein
MIEILYAAFVVAEVRELTIIVIEVKVRAFQLTCYFLGQSCLA